MKLNIIQYNKGRIREGNTLASGQGALPVFHYNAETSTCHTYIDSIQGDICLEIFY